MAEGKPELTRLLDRVNDLMEDIDWVVVAREIEDSHPMEKSLQLKAALINCEQKTCKALGIKSRF